METSAENGKRGWSSATNLAKDDFRGSSESSYAATGWTSLMDLSAIDNEEERLEDRRPTKLQIKEVIDNSNESASENDVEFIIQTEVEQLRLQVRELQARCERVEKEKSEILMRRLSTMETISSKASPNEIQKLQKKNEALVQEKNSLLTKIRELEKEVNSKIIRGERDREKDELRSKLKAAENLCENLMDENEDMKKEIRQLEEEIYELQDTFREEARNRVQIRMRLEGARKQWISTYCDGNQKQLEQRNCRNPTLINNISKKMSHQQDKTSNEMLRETKKVEETLQKIKGEFQNRPLKKATEFTTKVQLKKMVEEMEKEIGSSYGITSLLLKFYEDIKY
ncbi:hypothetical protein E2986_08231 [Frieseomelitta varia]|uniref:Uncharacterized protein n=1 Tax=Frieseomelitta varia TaxID=561572 RepID=A0A833RW14_9HYME|nr:hypothetical protein E2986_08231 [Frieseomelitta varia]